MKKRIKRLEAVMLGISLFLSTLFSNTAMAEGYMGQVLSSDTANVLTIDKNTVGYNAKMPPVAVRTESGNNTESQKTTFPVHVIHKTGNDKENFVIVIMGDGYTAQQQEQFVEDATKKAQEMLIWSPYKEYSDRINIYAVQAVSNESGISVYGGKSVDTYFHIRVFGKAAGFSNGGDEKAKALRQELEEKYLDAGASVGTIHMISNVNGNYGASVNSLFSFSANSDENDNGTVMAHEIAHSIGGLGDEYERYTNKPNTSAVSDADSIKWNKLLGFRGIGITMAGTETAFAPSRECMMRWLGQPFCEVCKMELARKLNNTDYVSRPKEIYVADPEISTPHSRTGTLDRDSEKYRINEKNIIKANEKDLEFRTVVQNLINREQHLKLSFCITAADGITVKYQKEKEFTIPALSNSYDPDAARESLSIVLNDVSGLVRGDKLEGKVVDTDTGEVLATDKTDQQVWNTVNIHYQLKNTDGTYSDIPEVAPAIVYVPANTTYVLRKPELSDYTYIGNSVCQDEIKVSEADTEITYYYQTKKDSQITPDNTPVVSESAEPSESSVPSESITPEESTAPIESAPAEPSQSSVPSESITPGESPTPTESAPAEPSESSVPSESITQGESTAPIEPAPDASANTDISRNKKEVLVVVKPAINKKTSSIKSINPIVKKAVKKAEKRACGQGKKILIKVRIKTPKRNKITLKLDKAIIQFLVRKRVKMLQWNSGNARVTMNQNSLNKIKKQMKKNVFLTIQRADKRTLALKKKKNVDKRPIYKLIVTGTKKKFCTFRVK